VSAPVTSIVARLAAHAEAHPQRLALSFPPGPAYTYAALWQRVRRLAAHFRDAGVGAGERLAILSDAPAEQALAFLGAMAAGAVPTILSHPSVKQSVERFVPTFEAILDRGTSWLIAGADLRPRVDAWLGAHQGAVRPLGLPDDAAAGPGIDPVPQGPASFLQYSSGTTGMRKGVVVTHAMFAAQAAAYREALGFGDDEVVVSWLPLYHDMGLVACLLQSLWAGVPSVHVSPFRWIQQPALLLDLVAEHRATRVWLPNFAFRVLVDRVPATHPTDLGTIRAIVNCSEPVRPAAHDAFLARFAGHGLAADALQCCYGMAENTFAITQTPAGAPPRRDVIERNGRTVAVMSSGRPIPGVEVRIQGAAGPAPAGAIGELEIRSPSLFAGYDGGGGGLDADGWFRTGDLGYAAGDDYFVTGRSKDLIIHRGINLHPEDVEEAVGTVPGCKPGRAVAFGVDDEAQGTEVVVVMLEADGEVAPARLAVQVRGRVFEHFGVVPADVVVVDPGSLVKSTSGKPSRSANRASYLDARGRPA